MKLRVLAYLSRHQSATDKQAAKFLGVARETAYQNLAKLCADGLAHRTKAYNPRGSWLVTFHLGPGPVAAPKTPDNFDSRKVLSAWESLKVCDPWMLPREFFQGVPG
jgi:hypothetical protein